MRSFISATVLACYVGRQRRQSLISRQHHASLLSALHNRLLVPDPAVERHRPAQLPPVVVARSNARRQLGMNSPRLLKKTALHKALNLYISPDAYVRPSCRTVASVPQADGSVRWRVPRAQVFEPTTSDDESHERETLVVERMTGNLLLNREPHPSRNRRRMR